MTLTPLQQTALEYLNQGWTITKEDGKFILSIYEQGEMKK